MKRTIAQKCLQRGSVVSTLRGGGYSQIALIRTHLSKKNDCTKMPPKGEGGGGTVK